MDKFRIMATTTFGLEAVAKREAQALGFENISVSDGYVEFDGDFEEAVKANLWFRTAEKILLVLSRFEAKDFDTLFEGVKAIKWYEIMESDAKFIVTGKSVKSQLSSVPACQSVAEKAVIRSMQQEYHIAHFPKTGAEYVIQIALLKDIATVTLNTSGESLHKRGYRVEQVAAPLKETMAAAMVELSFWKKDRVLLDPCCGSGTIAIEAALIGRNIAPGLFRSFAAENWSVIPKELWKKARAEARAEIDLDTELKIFASDINKRAAEMTVRNAENAGVDDCITVSQTPFNKLILPSDYGICVVNPPYAERMGNAADVQRLYRDMGRLFGKNKKWSVYVITSNEAFEKLYGKKADKKRKLFNGNVKTDYYQFYGERPPKAEQNQK